MKRKIISGKCAKCGAHLVVPTWKYCDDCTRPKNRDMSIPHYKVADVKWLIVRHFEGAFGDDMYWRDMHEIIALDSNDNEVGRLEFTEYSTCQYILKQLTNLYDAKVI